jgi:hypothetical protein
VCTHGTQPRLRGKTPVAARAPTDMGLGADKTSFFRPDYRCFRLVCQGQSSFGCSGILVLEPYGGIVQSVAEGDVTEHKEVHKGLRLIPMKPRRS